MKTFEKTHPWISFELDLRKFDHKLWMALGETASKCEHIAGVPLQPDTAEKLHLLYLAKGVRATTAIEGNTLSEEEVIERIEGNLPLPPSREYLGKEIDNILKGCNEIKEKLMKGEAGGLSVAEIVAFNKTVLNELELDKDVVPGVIRKHSVGVAGYRGAPAEDCEYLLQHMCEWLNRPEFNPQEQVIIFGVIRAIVAHLYIAWIHPFGDGNGRTARLLEFKILLLSGIPTPAAHLLSNHYNLTRTEYYRQLDYASKSKGDIIPFIQYAVEGFVDGLRSQLRVVQQQQLLVAWRDYVYSHFRDKTGKINDRMRKLVLDLSQLSEPVALAKLNEVSPRIAALYATKTPRTVRRDVEELLRVNLIRQQGNGYIANKEIMLSFLPERNRRERVEGKESGLKK
ncbi:MAG: Fic family protein [Nitrospirae bacterium]|nr:Fic family protein [Nitrospirota bacterium]